MSRYRKSWWAAALLGCGLAGCSPESDPASGAEPAVDPAFAELQQTIEFQAQQYIGQGNWQGLEDRVIDLAASGERATDGRFQLYKATNSIREWLELWDEDMDANFVAQFDEYREQVPDSLFQPILAAMQVHATAWRARGRGTSSTVSEEGWALFKERNATAWRMIVAAKAQSSALPVWYEQAIIIGMDANAPASEIATVFTEGLNRFPGYYSLYFMYARQFSPRWGGDYATADAFINAQVVAKTNPDGEVLYARLYWLLDQYGAGDPDFFDESFVDWPRMRTGFELLMKQFPKSEWNQANFVAYACRANDAATYLKWRKTVHPGEFKNAAPDGISLETCDTRFITKT